MTGGTARAAATRQRRVDRDVLPGTRPVDDDAGHLVARHPWPVEPSVTNGAHAVDPGLGSAAVVDLKTPNR